jgi:excisionase family DNA binding protein
MRISELSNLNANVSVCVTLADLKEFVSEMMVEAAARPQQTEETMLSVDQVCEVLGISANSLWRWGKSGYLKGQKVGRKVLYRKSDIDALQGK